MNEIKVTQSNTGTYTVNFECPDGEELSKANARLLFEESAISDVIDDLNMHRGDHALLARIAELEAERNQLREALKEIAKFADSEYGKRIPAPSCVEFSTIKRYAEKALKGSENEVRFL